VAASVPNPSPPARQKPLEVHEMVESPAMAGGIPAADHVRPPSVLNTAAIPAEPREAATGHSPIAAQTTADWHDTASRGSVEPGTVGSSHEAPAFSESNATAEWVLPPVPCPTAMQSDSVTQITSTRSLTPAGTEPGTHVAPPVREVSTCPIPPVGEVSLPFPALAPEVPTATHVDPVHDTPERSAGVAHFVLA